MTLWETIVVMVRRWYVLIPMLVLGGMAAMWVAGGVGREFTSTATFVVLSPDVEEISTSEGEIISRPLNPFLNTFSGRALGASLPALLTSDEVRSEVAEAGHSPLYEVAVDDALMLVEVGGASPEEVRRTVEFIMVDFPERAERAQLDRGAPETELATLGSVAATDPEANLQSSARVLAVLGTATLVASLGATFAVEGLVEVVRRRRSRRDEIEDEVDEAVGSRPRRVAG